MNITWPSSDWIRPLWSPKDRTPALDKRIRAFLWNSNVWRSMTLPAINAIVLAGKAVPQIPVPIPHLANTWLKYIGLMTLDLQITALIKTVKDFIVALVHHCATTILYTGTGIFVKGSNILLTVGGTIASAAATMGQLPLATQLFMVMRPWGLASLACMISLDVYAVFSDHRLINEMKQLLEGTDRNERLRIIFQLYANKVEYPDDDQELAVRIRSRIDRETWMELEKKVLELERESPWDVFKLLTLERRRRQLFATLIENVATHYTVMRANHGLTAIGYVAMAITRANPNTLIEATTNFSISLLYTIKFLWQKYQQIDQQIQLKGE